MSASSRVTRLLEQIDKMDGRGRRTPDVAAMARKLSRVEEDFFLRAVENGDSKVLRSGWPDFLLDPIDGGVCRGVEVKRNLRDYLRESQRATFAVLERHGIPTFVWTPESSDRLIPWRRFEGNRERPTGL